MIPLFLVHGSYHMILVVNSECTTQHPWVSQTNQFQQSIYLYHLRSWTHFRARLINRTYKEFYLSSSRAYCLWHILNISMAMMACYLWIDTSFIELLVGIFLILVLLYYTWVYGWQLYAGVRVCMMFDYNMYC